MRQHVESVGRSVDRGGALVRQLLAFGRERARRTRTVKVTELLRELEDLLRRLLGEGIELAIDAAPGLPPVALPQFEQVLLTLLANARDAMPRGGRLTIETRDVRPDRAYAAGHPDARPGPHVLLAVGDTGTGMTSEVKARLFEPFFTTKGPGKGSGLGLATVYGIVKQSGGSVAVDSEPGRGTTFQVYLPRAEGPPAPRSVAGLRPPERGSETVLLVEDEDAVRRLAREVLEGNGYAVIEASHGGEALRRAEEFRGPIHLLLTDVVMPGLGGRQLAEGLSALHPETRVLYLSGYTEDAVVRHGVLQAETNFLQKPFSLTALTQKVREVLDAGPAANGEKGASEVSASVRGRRGG